ncbi:MAG: M6 family metalloprotease domain-containing protein, partial [Bacteroidetes bacterium]|nr:M6 family metalloprotease domain-containing protein [Bacteroidota bacterium]
MILANFSNTTTTFTQANFNNYMNQLNYNSTGSFKDFYIEVSYGQLTVNTTVTVWVTLPNTHDYYGPGAKWGEFAFAAVTAANNQTSINFASFDNNSDGVVDGVAIIHQGQGQEETGNVLDIWSHSWDLSSAGYTTAERTFDGVLVDAYTTMPEKNSVGMGTIGVMCHEFGHNLGSPDFYDTDYATGGSYSGTGYWDVMASGSWNGSAGTKPAHPNAWIKALFNWTTPIVLTSTQTKILRNAQLYTDVVRYNTTTSNEYFLCENRQQTGFDVGIPGHGLIIYHVDGAFIAAHSGWNDINAGSHQGLYPVCASSTGNPPTTYGSISSSSCPFPGTGSKTSFTDVTTPNSHSWADANTSSPITGIAENTSTKEITFNFASAAADPPLAVGSISASQTICVNTTPAQLTGVAPSNGTNPTYQWQSSLTNVTFSNITGATALNYQPGALTATTYYRQMQNATGTTGGPLPTNTVIITVNPLLPVSVSIAASANPVCTGSPVTFTATPVNGGSAPAYQWKKNGIVVTGFTGASYTNSFPGNGDVVICALTSNVSCTTGNPATSNAITITLATPQPVSVTIAASANNVCAGTSVTFTATPANGGALPAYQWKKGISVIAGATNATYSYAPANGDVITCLLTSSATCVSNNPATSNAITMAINPQLAVGSISASQTICTGTAPAQLNGIAPSNGTNPTHQWQSSLNNITFTNISGSTSTLNFQPGVLTSTTYYRQLQNASGTCGGPL